jgi:hypothetical protein
MGRIGRMKGIGDMDEIGSFGRLGGINMFD